MQVHSEQLGDLAIIASILRTNDVIEKVDRYFPTHGAWQGPSFGETIFVFLLYIISEADHRLYKIEEWVSNREEVLRWLAKNDSLESKHFNDDRLGILLEKFAGTKYDNFHKEHLNGLISFYDLSVKTVRADSTKIDSFRKRFGLFQRGHSQNNKRVDLAQIKTMMVTLDPLALPIANINVGGNRVDDQLYKPAIEQAWNQGLPQKGLLIVGDTKLGNSENFTFIAKDNYYLCPLSKKQYSTESLDQSIAWIEEEQKEEIPIYRSTEKEEKEIIAYGVELPSKLIVSKEGGFKHYQRQLLVRSLDLERVQKENLIERCTKAREALHQRFVPKRGRKTLREEKDAEAFIEQILKKYKVAHLLNIELLAPASAKDNNGYKIRTSLDKAAYDKDYRRCGWRCYATNTDKKDFDLSDLIQCYRKEFRIEQQFHYLLNKCTALKPIYLSKENRILALIRILLMALQFVALIQHTIRKNISTREQKYLTNLIPGNPERKVFNPTTTMILNIFKAIHLVRIRLPDKNLVFEISELSEIQRQVLDLLNLESKIYLHPRSQKTG